MELTWFQNYWLNTTKTIDFGIDSVRKSKNALSFTITREGVPLPVEFSVELKDGTINYYYIPLDLNNNVKTDFYRTTQSLAKWSCGEPNYSISLPGISIKDVLKITLDPDGFLPDVFMENNSWPIEKE